MHDKTNAPAEQEAGAKAVPVPHDVNEIPVDDPEWGPSPRRTWTDGPRTPSLPSAAETARLFAAVEPNHDGDTVTCIRVLVADPSPSTKQRLLKHLLPEPTVLGTSEGEMCGPERDDAFDVLLAPEQEPLGAASALTSLDGVDGVALVKYPLPLTDDAGSSESPDLTPAVEASSTDLDAELAGDVPEPPEDVFEELRDEVEPIEYDDLVAELDAADVGTADGVEADIDPMLEDEGETDPERSESMDVPAEAPDDEGAGDSPEDASEDVLDTDGDEALDPDAVLSALVTALDERTLRESELAAFRDVLGLKTPESLRARVDHMQGQVNEVLAYSSDLESFIDETNGGETVHELADDVSTLAARVEQLSTATGSIAEQLAECERDQQDLTERVEGQGERVAAIADEQERLDADLADALDDVDERLAELESTVEGLRTWRDDLEAALVPGAADD